MNLIFSAFAFKENCGNSHQLGNKKDAEKLNIYMQNIVVALTSAKLNNPEDEVMLVCNEEPDETIKCTLSKKDIKIKLLAFNDYNMPASFPWSLAFYKLCALKELAKDNYDKLLLMDSDTITMQSFKDIWDEAEYGMMLYNINHTFSHEHRGVQRDSYRKLYPNENCNIIHYGGEFICGKKEDILAFVAETDEIYEKIKACDFDVDNQIGDEMILSAAAAHYKKKGFEIIEAGPYIYRYWTEVNYLISTNTQHNPVCIWHIPSEKDRGFLYLYNYYMKHGAYPDKAKTAKIMGIWPAKRPKSIMSFYTRVLRKLSNMRGK